MRSFRNFDLVTKKTWRTISVILLLLFALSLRLHHLDYESLWMDEIRQVSYYPHSFSQIIKDAATMNQPPLDYWIGHIVYAFSNSDFAVRLPSALCGVGAVFFLAILVAKICSLPVALGTGIIAALLPFNIYFSQEARPYSIAIFFFLALLWSLDLLLTSKNKNFVKAIILLFFLTVFLYSRSLSPLVITFVIVFTLTVWFGILIARDGFVFEGKQKLIILAIIIFFLALLLYIPSFKIILSQGSRYVYDTSLTFGIHSFITGIRNFDIFPIWRAFVVQTEPLTLSLLILAIVAPYFAWQMKLRHKNSLWLNSVILFSGAGILNIFIFQAKSSLPFRPPYAIYLLPLTLILAAVSFQGLWNMAAKMRGFRIAHLILLFFAAALIFKTGASALDFKADRKKSDWRGVCSYLNTNFGSGQILIFDSLLPYGRRTFNGFTRYYQGRSQLFSMGQASFILPGLIGLQHEPVVILFQHHEYYLTGNSKYPFSFGRALIDFGKIGQDPFLQVAEFNGFCVIRLKENSNTFIRDAYEVINRLLLHLPQNSSIVEMYLAAAGLASICGLNHWQNHLNKAERLAGEQYRSKVTGMGDRIGNYLQYQKKCINLAL